MVALLPPSLAMQDAFLAAGLGVVLALVYRALRFFAGSAAWAVCLCDVAAIVAGGIFYRGVCTTAFYAGMMRWYTALSLLVAFAFANQLLAPPLNGLRNALQAAAHTAFRAAAAPLRALQAQLKQSLFLPLAEKMQKMNQKLRAKPAKKQKEPLQKHKVMLYNSD